MINRLKHAINQTKYFSRITTLLGIMSSLTGFNAKVKYNVTTLHCVPIKSGPLENRQ